MVAQVVCLAQTEPLQTVVLVAEDLLVDLETPLTHLQVKGTTAVVGYRVQRPFTLQQWVVAVVLVR